MSSARRVLVICTAVLGAATLAACGAPSDCDQGNDASRIARQQTSDPSVALVKAASLKRDGGQYIAANYRLADKSDFTAVWYIANDGNGSITALGEVTKLVSDAPDSGKVRISVGSKGFSDAKACVE